MMFLLIVWKLTCVAWHWSFDIWVLQNRNFTFFRFFLKNHFDLILEIIPFLFLSFLYFWFAFEDFFIPDKEAVFFGSKKELISKIKFYSANDNLRKKIAKIGHKKYHSLFNSTLVTKYMLSKILGIIPDHLLIPYPAEDLFWVLFQKSTVI